MRFSTACLENVRRARGARLIRDCSGRRAGSVRAAARGAIASLVHETLELLAILGLANIVEEIGEFAVRVLEPAALFFEPREFASLPLVECAIAGRRGKAASPPGTARPAAGPRPRRRGTRGRPARH